MINASFPPYIPVLESTTTNNSYIGNETTGLQLRYSPAVTAAVVIVTSVLTTVVILGNILIITSVCQVHKLRQNIGNFLIASLAVCDMLVGLIVMPIAIVQDVLTEWPLGKDVCLIWVTFDVALCTSSILHLMVIAIDRYCIVAYISYEVKRSGKYIMMYIAFAWLVSALISVTPAFVGWLPEYGPDGRGCKVNQNIEYQMYATFVAFYVPLIVKLCLYGKLFLISRRIIRAEAKNHPKFQHHSDSISDMQTSIPSDQSISTEHPSNGVTTTKNGKPKEVMAVAESTPLNSSLTNNIGHHIVGDATSDSEAPSERDWLRKNEQQNNNNHLTVQVPRAPSRSISRCSSQHIPPTKVSAMKRLSMAITGRVLRVIHREEKSSHKTNMAAIRTLGAIMGLFTICWLPFFVLAVVSPLCKDVCNIPPIMYSVFLWIGYANSCFNPFIYAQFNREFRTPFKEIMCCRCSTVDSLIRRSEYEDKFGAEHEH